MNYNHLINTLNNKEKILVKTIEDLHLVVNKILSLNKQFIYLIGDFGAGKTAFVKALAKALGINQEITSPSFNFMFSYNKLIHIDLDNYNSDLSEFEDYFEDKFVAIEWANKLKFLYNNSVVIFIKMLENEEREFNIHW
ncbi:tRNA (adenosine(37)-N6)-threonylcarbamoyltransferase complex ATPase subunit type 1 TsaE [Mycoplasma sp. 1654_15]|uniref:tRNA (adenosine(37)-N6)-threonylcarbamoyltransferase complex ATPase subunit type 1 TsaE n=1 Tax=Mycoplasma sp. 1654_15 TaxID=2725994 RepID=UPI00144A1ECE|nr:tRNA (adenosine(37)-N6)-threonylcarbamoyltransferase complex ATPase subunit type 1 TsaE [Mycoplasma sp. 1654_15]QJB71520.1 tRNA (adenosine(37)-N6)-threonylcarbamoyltransferase complex ATPase subunit type 1 TsaE [Mycoplasma sp. 1654_15]